MAGETKFEKLFGAIAKAEANLSNLGRNFDRHCEDDERRHEENISAIRENTAAIAELSQQMAPLTSAVGRMQPVVDGYQVTRWKIVGGVIGISVVFGAGGWIVVEIGKATISLVMRKIGS